MTRERKHAVKLWEYIKSQIEELDDEKLDCSDRYFRKAADVSECKGKFFVDNSEMRVSWFAGCWFCQYVDCNKCPIRDGKAGCSTDTSLYGIVRYCPVKSRRLEACSKIIAALKGEYDISKEV